MAISVFYHLPGPPVGGKRALRAIKMLAVPHQKTVKNKQDGYATDPATDEILFHRKDSPGNDKAGKPILGDIIEDDKLFDLADPTAPELVVVRGCAVSKEPKLGHITLPAEKKKEDPSDPADKSEAPEKPAPKKPAA